MTDHAKRRAEALLGISAEQTPTVSTAEVQRLITELLARQGEEPADRDPEAADGSGREHAEGRLRRSEERLEMILQSGNIGIWDRDLLTDETVWNDQLYRLVGRERGSRTTGETFFDYIHPDDLARVREHLVRELEQGHEFVDEFRVVREDGEIRWVASRGRIIRDEGGRPIRIAGVNYDVTERALQLQDLAARERELATLADSAPDPVVGTDSALRITSWSRAAERVYGWTATEALGRDVDELLDTQFCTTTREEAMTRLQRDGHVQVDATHRDRWGGEHQVESNVVALRDPEQRFSGTLGVLRDVTARRETEQALRRSEQRLALAVSETRIGIFDMEIATDELLTTEQNLRLLGLRSMSPAEPAESTIASATLSQRFHYREWLERVHPDDQAGVSDAMSRCAEKHVGFQIEFRVDWPDDDSVHWIAARGVFRHDPDEQPRVLGITLEVTERKQAEAEQRRLNEQLEALVEQHKSSLRRLCSDLALAEERVRKRIAGEVHDELGQVLAMCQNEADWIETDELPQRAAESLCRLRELLEKAATETRELTYELGSPVLHSEGLVPALEQLCVDLERRHGVAVVFSDDGVVKQLSEGAKLSLFRSVRELLLNVTKHARASEVRCSLSCEDGVVRAEVQDNGVGFDATQAGKGLGPGGGFGLFNLREHARHVGGRLQVESTQGAGTRVALELPLDC